MASWAEIRTAISKGCGFKPTSFLLRWSPSFRNPIHFDLVEVSKCEADGGIVTRKLAQSPRAVEHLGHRIKSPGYFSFWTFLKVQLRMIQ